MRKNFKFRIFWGVALAFFASCAGSDIFPDIGTNLANPISVKVDSDAARAYLINSNSTVIYKNGSIHVLDITAPEAPVRLAYQTVPSFSGNAYRDGTGKYLYVTNRLSDSNNDLIDTILRVNIDEASGDFMKAEHFNDGANPFGIASDSPPVNLYVATSASELDRFAIGSPDAITAISLNNLSVSDGSTLRNLSFSDVAITGNLAFLSIRTGGILVVDVVREVATHFIWNLTSPRGIVSDGANIYVVDVQDDGDGSIVPKLFKFDSGLLPTQTGTIVELVDRSTVETGSVEIGTDPQEVLVATEHIFVSNMGADTISVIDKTSFAKARDDVSVGDGPFGLGVYSPGGTDTYLYVTNIYSNNVSIVRLSDFSVPATYN